MNNELRLVIAGGGTAGHISPMLAIADAVTARCANAQITAVGTSEGLETRLVPEAGYQLALISKVPMPRSVNMDSVKFPVRFLRAVNQAKAILREQRAQALLGVGGYVCTPMYLAAKQIGVPIFVHEANSVAGMANKLGARYATAVGTTFADTGLPNERQVGMPMRSNVARMNREQLRGTAREHFGLTPTDKALFVTGGSSGAQSINTAIAESLPQLHAAGIQTIHITGRDKQIRDESGALLNYPGYTQIEYENRMDLVYAAADLVVCRSGAGTVSELAVAAVPSVLVPLPIGNGEQRLNARELVAAGGGRLIADEDFTAEAVAQTVIPLLGDAAELEAMSLAAAGQARADAAEIMAEIIIGAVADRPTTDR